MNKIRILLFSLYGYLLKWGYDLHLFAIPRLGSRPSRNYIVSLTSYGRRVKSGVVCYSIYSILRQTVQPKQIILWLDENEWNNATLPSKVARLRKYGVDIRFSENMRSYKKILPTLKLYPGNGIITIDDDVIYHSSLLEHLIATADTHPGHIISIYARAPQKNHEVLAPYTQWPQHEKETTPRLDSMPIGVGGVLYPPHALKEEMLDYSLARNYAPIADDVWLWAAALAAGTKKCQPNWTHHAISFDAIYQYFHTGSALQHSNVKGKGLTNDEQIAATLKYIKENYQTTL